MTTRALAVVLALALGGAASAQETKESAAEKGKDLKKVVRDSEKALLDEVGELKKAIGVPIEKEKPKPEDKDVIEQREADKEKPRKPERTSFGKCEAPCPACEGAAFCRARAERVHESCKKVLGHSDELKARFVQLRLDYRKLTGLLARESERLARDAENPPDTDDLDEEDRARLKASYRDMARHVRELRPVYERRFEALERTEGAALAQLALLRSRSAILADALAVIRAQDHLKELEAETRALEETVQDMSASIDKALAAFGDLAKTIQVEK